MRLYARLILLIGLATLIPLGVTGLVASRIASEAQVEQARELHGKQASGLAMFTATWLNDRLRGLALSVSLWDVSTLDADKLMGLQRLLYRQYDAVNVVSVVDPEGTPLSEPLALGDPVAAGQPAHEPVARPRLLAFSDNLPITEALAEGLAVGEPYLPPGGRHRVVPVAIAARGGKAIVGVELSLAPVAQQVLSQRVAGGATVLVDSAGGVIAGDPAGLVEPGLTRSFVGQVEGELSYDVAGGAASAAFNSVGDVGWTVIVAMPAELVEAPAQAIWRQTAYMYVLAIVLAAAMAVVGARQLSRPIVVLKQFAQRVGDGELGRTVEPTGSDEVTELMYAFNQMSRRLADNKATIDAKNAEIESWNRELLARVEERTGELKQSQARLVRTARMAAAAEMGAGLAHSLNNPVAGILGMIQLARAKAPGGGVGGMLAAVEEQAQRCREILASLNRLSGSGPVGDRVPVDLHELLRDVLVLVGGAFEGGAQRVEHDPSVSLPTLGDPALLGQALAQLLRSLRSALGPSGVLRVRGAKTDAEVSLIFELSATPKAGGDDWLAWGMGLWVARQVFQEHEGRLEEPSVEHSDGPARYTVSLPAR